MSDPALGLLMLVLIVVVIMMGFPTAFTLMGLGILFGFIAYFKSGQAWADNLIFDLMVQRTYGAMTNDVLISIPLFVLMGYVMERGALVDKMFYSVQLAFRDVPAALAVQIRASSPDALDDLLARAATAPTLAAVFA
jgi:TRAP-type mannitol/chloroaromatic compound transport system permease large subunit